MFEAPHTLQSGETITLRAWPYTEFSANYADYLNLLALLRAGFGAAEPDPSQQSLLNRVLLASIRANDVDLLSVADLPGLLEGIFELNRIEEIAAKTHGLHARVVQAVENAHRETLERTTSPGSPTSSSPSALPS